MFNLFNLGAKRECWIENSTLYVKDLFTDRVDSYAINPTKFFKDHARIEDTVAPMPVDKHVIWQVEDAEHNIIIGRSDASVTVVNNYRVISCTSWDISRFVNPAMVIGYHRNKVLIDAVLLDMRDMQTVYVHGSPFYAYLQEEFEMPDEEDLEFLLATATAHVEACTENVMDSYFILDWKENQGIAKRCRFEYVRRGTNPVRNPI